MNVTSIILILLMLSVVTPLVYDSMASVGLNSGNPFQTNNNLNATSLYNKINCPIDPSTQLPDCSNAMPKAPNAIIATAYTFGYFLWGLGFVGQCMLYTFFIGIVLMAYGVPPILAGMYQFAVWFEVFLFLYTLITGRYQGALD